MSALFVSLHLKFIIVLRSKLLEVDFFFWTRQLLTSDRMNGIGWGLTRLQLLYHKETYFLDIADRIHQEPNDY